MKDRVYAYSKDNIRLFQGPVRTIEMDNILTHGVYYATAYSPIQVGQVVSFTEGKCPKCGKKRTGMVKPARELDRPIGVYVADKCNKCGKPKKVKDGDPVKIQI